MGVFSEFFKQLLSKKDRKKISSSNSSDKSINKKPTSSSTKSFSGTKSSLGIMESRSTTSSSPATTSPLKKVSTKEGKSFKYNEAGRRYHGNDDVAYVMPNDDDEADRLHGQHWVLRYILQRNYHAPVTKMLEEGATVLDSGCGPATWTFEMAETYTQSKIHGIDISFVFPETIKPVNVELVIGNIAKHIPYPDNTFDYIHQRLLMVGLTSEDWDNTLKELYRVLKPGGYVELAEFSADYSEKTTGPLWTKLQDATANIFKSKGIPTRISTELESRLAKAGFVNEKLEITPLPINHNGKRGELLWNDLKHGYLNIRPALVKANPEFNDVATYEKFIEDCGAETKEYGTCTHWYAAYAQKPVQG